jgi:hypothetical protein
MNDRLEPRIRILLGSSIRLLLAESSISMACVRQKRRPRRPMMQMRVGASRR